MLRALIVPAVCQQAHAQRGNFKNMADEIVLSFQDSLLRQSDLRLLEEGRWLNDRLIGFMFEYVSFSILPKTKGNFCSEKSRF